MVWLLNRDDPYVEAQAKDALNFNISFLLYGLAAAISIIILVGIIALPAVVFTWFALVFVASVKAANGENLLMGKGQTAIGTLVERWSRYVMLFILPDGNTAEAVRDALTATVQRLPDHLWQSLTWDQGREMAQHVQFSIDTGVQVFFCDPQSPWQRGTNENTNGLLRQYFPKGTDMSKLTQADLDQAAYSLNTRPRQTLGWMTPSDKLAEALR